MIRSRLRPPSNWYKGMLAALALISHRATSTPASAVMPTGPRRQYAPREDRKGPLPPPRSRALFVALGCGLGQGLRGGVQLFSVGVGVRHDSVPTASAQ